MMERERQQNGRTLADGSCTPWMHESESMAGSAGDWLCSASSDMVESSECASIVMSLSMNDRIGCGGGKGRGGTVEERRCKGR